MYRKFASLANPSKYGYAYESSPEWNSRDAQVDRCFRMFETYGDGMIQHSTDWPITLEFMADYLASLTMVLLTDEELSSNLIFTLGRRPNVEEIDFAAAVVYRESDDDWNKRRYFSVSEKKVSAKAALQYDKRYEQVKQWCTGEPDAIYRMLIPEYADGLQRFLYASAIYDWQQPQSAHYMARPAEFLKWFEKDSNQREKACELDRSLRMAKAATEMWRQKGLAEQDLDNLRRRIASRAETADMAGKLIEGKVV